MPKRQETLARMLAPFAEGSITLARPSAMTIGNGGAEVSAEIGRTFKMLGGMGSEIPARVGAWDVQLRGVAVELDEERHFNRYRLVTLGSHLYPARFPAKEYRSYCEKREAECLAAASFGKNWESPSTIAQFGPAGAPRDLAGLGSPRWKQRAFYDFLKDLAPVLTGTKVARLSIWDMIENDGESTTVGRVLDRNLVAAIPTLVALIERRSGVQLGAV